MLQEYPNCVIYTFASSAVRVCMAAQEAGLNIKGTRFLVTGEPLTPQKKKEIEETGSRAVPIYGISEAGVIAAGCARPYPDSDSCHFLKDTNAVITHRLVPSHSDTEVESFLFTSLLYESPKFLLNVGMGDYGKVWIEPCSCELGTLGFDVHVSGIRSYEKLTGEGVTFVDTDFINIIENELPRRFGGQSTDYQLVEDEDTHGLTRLRLLISPRVGTVDEQKVVEAFIQLLKMGECSPESWAQSGSDIWAQARTLRIKREYPIPTRSGKILPFHIIKP
jgi:phenylacetate-coenzyme A ligase PaaK-like adenylate-forming protein